MTRLEINQTALQHNINIVRQWMNERGCHLNVVIKLLCGNEEVLQTLLETGVKSFSGSRLSNIETLRYLSPNCEIWYLRPPAISQIHKVVELCDGSLNSELSTISALNEEAERQGKTHKVIIMIELGELREGVLPGNLVNFYESILKLRHIEVCGIGTNLGCLSGVIPSIDQFMQLILYRELLELKFKVELSIISAGTSAVLPMLLKGGLPKDINHFRVGESLFLGNNLLTGEPLPPLRSDVFTLHAEVVESREKSLVPLGETAEVNPFPSVPIESFEPGARGLRALLEIGHLDCDLRGLTPVDSNHQIAGASSDLTVINIQNNEGKYAVGTSVSFRPNYAATLSLMNSKYIEKVIVDDFGEMGPTVRRSYDAPLVSSFQSQEEKKISKTAYEPFFVK